MKKIVLKIRKGAMYYDTTTKEHLIVLGGELSGMVDLFIVEKSEYVQRNRQNICWLLNQKRWEIRG